MYWRGAEEHDGSRPPCADDALEHIEQDDRCARKVELVCENDDPGPALILLGQEAMEVPGSLRPYAQGGRSQAMSSDVRGDLAGKMKNAPDAAHGRRRGRL